MQYATPQFIEEEGRIIFFLTFRQFFWLVGAGAVIILLYYILPFYFFVVASIIVGLAVAAAAFVKVDNTSMLKILMNFIGFTMGTKTYTWKRKDSANPFKVEKKPEPVAPENSPKTPPTPTQVSRLQSIKQLVETKK